MATFFFVQHFFVQQRAPPIDGANCWTKKILNEIWCWQYFSNSTPKGNLYTSIGGAPCWTKKCWTKKMLPCIFKMLRYIVNVEMYFPMLKEICTGCMYFAQGWINSALACHTVLGYCRNVRKHVNISNCLFFEWTKPV